MSNKSAIYSVDSVDSFIKETIIQRNAFDDDPFIVTNLTRIQQRFNDWVTFFPSVEPFFAMKARYCTQIVTLLAGNSCRFDVASLSELKSAVEAGTETNNIIYSQPYKQPSHLLYALQHGILSVCDSVNEIIKISEIAPLSNCKYPRILIRILPTNSEGYASVPLSAKYGAPLTRLLDLVRAANKSNVTIVGISFHVGSDCHSAIPYQKTLELSRIWWDRLENELGDNLEILDIGGGFPAHRDSDCKFSVIAKDINKSLSEVYGDIQSRMRVIAEPGRYMVADSTCVVANVLAEKYHSEGGPSFVLNTGVYGALGNSTWEEAVFRGIVPYVLNLEESNGQSNSHSDKRFNGNHLQSPCEEEVVLWGPTCDVSDKLAGRYQLSGLKRGDWIVFPELGAYNISTMTTFNGFQHPKIFYVRSPEL